MMSIKKHSVVLILGMVFGLSACKSDATVSKTVSAPQDTKSTSDTKPDKKTILFFGNSLTAGLGLDEEFAFPTLIQTIVDSLKLPYTVVNAGLSGETTADGKVRIEWILKQKVDVFVLELGANDMLRGQDVKNTEKNLREILDKVKQKYPESKLVVAGMQAPPNMGKAYTDAFAAIYPKLAKDYQASLIPFLLDGVGGIAKLNLADGKHPNAEGQKIVAANVWKVLHSICK